MAEIKAFCAWRYNRELGQNIGKLISPMYDASSEKYRSTLYHHPNNSIHLSIPIGNHPPKQAAKTLSDWKQRGIIVKDPIPGIYIYYQYFSLPGELKAYCRKGFICNIRLYDWDEGIVLKHENTTTQAVKDRMALLGETELNVCPTHGLYTDESFLLEKYMDRSMRRPLNETRDCQGVRNVLSVINDPTVISQFVERIKGKEVIIADGHHRYEGALAYRKKKMADNPGHTGNEAYNFHLIFLTNTASDDLRILPTHRLIKDQENFDEGALIKKFEKNFFIRRLADPGDMTAVLLDKRWTFGLLSKQQASIVSLKPEVFSSMKWHFPEEIKRLDLTVMHYFIIEEILGIDARHQGASAAIGYNRSFSECLAQVQNDQAQLALITREVSIEEVRQVCGSGYTMPKKSTYFYPKVTCGLVFGSIKPGET